MWENVTAVLVTMCLFWFNYHCGDNDPGQMLWGHFGKWGHSLKSVGQSSRGCLKGQIRSTFWFRGREKQYVDHSARQDKRTNMCMYLSLMLACPGCQRSGTIVSPVISCFLFGRPGTLLWQTHPLPLPTGVTSCSTRPCSPRWAVNQRHDVTSFRNSEFYLCSVQQLSRKTKFRECKTAVTLIKVRNPLPKQAQELRQCNTGQIVIRVCD